MPPWAGETLFAAVQGGFDWLHQAALWTTAGALTVLARRRPRRWHFAGYSRSQEAPKTRFARFRTLDRRRQCCRCRRFAVSLVKDVKIFLRDVSHAAAPTAGARAAVSLQLPRARSRSHPHMSGFIKNVYAFINLGMAGFVMATVAVRFVFPAVSAEGSAFWIIRTSPISMHDFLWSKFWTAVLPVLLFTEALTIAANQLLGVDPFLKLMAAATIFFLTFALSAWRAASARGIRASTPMRLRPLALRRRHVHDCRRCADHCHDRAGRLAIVDVPDGADRALPVSPDARALRDDCHELQRGGDRLHGNMVARHAIRSEAR